MIYRIGYHILNAVCSDGKVYAPEALIISILFFICPADFFTGDAVAKNMAACSGCTRLVDERKAGWRSGLLGWAEADQSGRQYSLGPCMVHKGFSTFRSGRRTVE